jgi:lysophospholipase L1-like esterase
MMYRKIALIAMALALPAAGGENLLKNGSFAELDASGEPVGWGGYDKKVWRLAKGEGVNGSNAFVYESADGKGHGVPEQFFKLEPGKKYVYSVKVRHENLALADKKRMNGVQVCLMGFDADGKRTCGYFHHGMQGTWTEWYELKEFIMEVPLWTKSARFSISLWSGITGKAWFSDARVEEYVPPLVEKLVTSAYRDKAWTGKVRFAASLNLPKESAQSFKGAFIYRDAKGKETRVAPDSMDAETAFLSLDIQSLAKGEQTLRFELAGADGKVAASAARAFTRLDTRPKEYKVWFDEHGRWIVNGKPFFPLSVGENKLTKEVIPAAVEAGFNAIRTGGNPDNGVWDYCRTNGLKVIRSIGNLYYGERFTMNRGWKSYEDQYNFLTNRIETTGKYRPELLAWYLNDEPRPALRPKMVKQQKLFETFDPTHPTQSVFDHPEFVRGFLDCFDDCGIDPYPIGRWPVSQVSDWLVDLKRGATGVKPFSVVIQAMDWNWFRMGPGMPTPHFPTFGELRNMTWQAIVGGARGIWYYGYNHFREPNKIKDYDRNYNLLKRVSTEVRKFLPVLLSVEEPVKVTLPRQSKLLVRSWRMGGESFVLVVNALGEGARAKLKLSERFERGFLEMGEGVDLEDGDTLDVVMEPLGCALVHLTDSKPHLVFAGDSLLDAGGERLGRGSWGEQLRPSLKDNIAVVNTARGGTSTRTFRAGDYWHEAMAKTRPGDWVVISFGHNDSSGNTDRSVTVEDFRRNLTRFAEEVRAKGANPLFVTPVATCTFKKDGTYSASRGLTTYADAMKEVAAALKAPVIDLYARTCADLIALGKDKARAGYMVSVDAKDCTHTTKAGAKRYAGFFVEETKVVLPSFADWLK